jgi:hypothetical protein
MKHSLTGGSNAHVWWYCPGSVYLSKVVPVIETEAMKEGTRLHEEAAICITGSHPAKSKIVDSYLRMLPANNESMKSELRVEHHEFEEEAYGTIDARWIDENDRPNICDLKTGKTPVEVKGNEQLLTYAYFHAMTWCFQTQIPILHIAQPKVSNHLLTWEPTDEEWEAAKKQIDWALKSVYEGPTELKTGSHCSKCKARGFCPEKRKQDEQPW